MQAVTYPSVIEDAWTRALDEHGQLNPVDEHPTRTLTADQVQFGHPAEQALARLFDWYGVTWEYEPHMYPYRWNETGQPTRWFRPDFWLPNHGHYIEVTVAGPAVINRKHQKIRAVETVYGIQVRLTHRDQLASIGERHQLNTDAVPTGNHRQPQPVKTLNGRGSNDVALRTQRQAQ